MGRRQDGRIEPGQRLATAISARAWNRAQDAADVVLNDRIGFGAEAAASFPRSLVVPVSVTTTVQNVGIGHVVRIIRATARTPDLTAGETFSPELHSIEGELHIPPAFALNNDFRQIYRTPFGVIVGGTQMPRPGQDPSIVRVCIAGLCWARVRYRLATTSEGAFVQPAMRRLSSDTVENLTGVFDQTDAGIARLLWTQPPPARIVDTGQTEVTWGLVVL